MDLDNLNHKKLKKEIRNLPFEKALSFYIKILKYYAKKKKMKNYLTCHSFLNFIKDNFQKFKAIIEEDNKIKSQMQELFEINMKLESDNLITIIKDDAHDDRIIELLNDKLDFKKYYLTDDIMSRISTTDKIIYQNLEQHEKKYIYSALYNIYFDEIDKIKIYRNNLEEYSKDFKDKLFNYSEIISDNTPNEEERYKDINKAMFNFTDEVLNTPEKLYNYIYNIVKIYDNAPNEKNIYNTFLISMKYPEIHNFLLEQKINDKDIYSKIKVISSLPLLNGIKSIEDLKKISIEELYRQEINTSNSVNNKPDSADAKNNYEYEIFDNNRQVIKISDDDMKVVQLTDDDIRVKGTEYSHIDGLRVLYPEFSDKEIVGEIIIPVNTIYHDIIITTEGDSINIWLPNIDNISLSEIEKLKNKLDEIRDFSEISVIVATECNGEYLDIPFTSPDILIEYLKANKKVK